MVRKVQAYLRNIDDKIIEDEAKLQELSEKCEHPPNYMQSHSTPTTQVYNSLEYIKVKSKNIILITSKTFD